jgi:hypothetical protein
MTRAELEFIVYKAIKAVGEEKFRSLPMFTKIREKQRARKSKIKGPVKKAA